MYDGDSGHKASISVSINLVGWKGKKSVRAYVARNDRVHYLRLINADTSKFDKNKFQEQRNLENNNENKNIEVKKNASIDKEQNTNEEITTKQDKVSKKFKTDNELT